MHYNPVPCKNDFDSDIIHSALILKWNSLAENIEHSSDFESIRLYCSQLIRVLDMISSMEFSEEA